MSPFSGAILTGGQSRRMGADKAFILVDGIPMVRRVADALWAAGATEVLTIGGDTAALTGLGLDARPDPLQGDGPLGGLLSALDAARCDRVVVVATDLYRLDGATVGQLLAALDANGDVAAAVAVTTQRQPLCAVWRRLSALVALRAAHAAGERAVHRAMAALTVAEVAVDAAAVADADEQADLPGNLGA